MGDDTIEVEAKSLAADALPGFMMMDEKQRRMRDYYDAARSGRASKTDARFLASGHSSSTRIMPLIEAISKMDHKNPDLAKELIHEVYDLALLSQREMDPHMLHDFINRTNHILEALAVEALKNH